MLPFIRSLMRGVALGAMFVGAIVVHAGSALAQTTDTSKTKAPVAKPDTTKGAPAATKRPAVSGAALSSLRTPPITPKRAFLYSLMIPGWGQSRLDRGTAGALFAAIELGSIAMVAKSGTDLKQARRYSGDSLPENYTLNSEGKIVNNGSFPGQFPTSLVNTRRLHREDWFAALLFNHLISGADAFVAAQLWDVPASVAVKPYVDGVALVATVHW